MGDPDAGRHPKAYLFFSQVSSLKDAILDVAFILSYVLSAATPLLFLLSFAERLWNSGRAARLSIASKPVYLYMEETLGGYAPPCLRGCSSAYVTLSDSAQGNTPLVGGALLRLLLGSVV